METPEAVPAYSKTFDKGIGSDTIILAGASAAWICSFCCTVIPVAIIDNNIKDLFL